MIVPLVVHYHKISKFKFSFLKVLNFGINFRFYTSEMNPFPIIGRKLYVTGIPQNLGLTDEQIHACITELCLPFGPVE